MEPLYSLSSNGRVFGTHNHAFKKSVMFVLSSRDTVAAVSRHIHNHGLTNKIEFMPASRFRMQYEPGSGHLLRPINKRILQVNVCERDDIVLRNHVCGIDTFLVEEINASQKCRTSIILDGAFVDVIDPVSHDMIAEYLDHLYTSQ